MATEPIRVPLVGLAPRTESPAVDRWAQDVTTAVNRLLEEIVLLREAVNTLIP